MKHPPVSGGPPVSGIRKPMPAPAPKPGPASESKPVLVSHYQASRRNTGPCATVAWPHGQRVRDRRVRRAQHLQLGVQRAGEGEAGGAGWDHCRRARSSGDNCTRTITRTARASRSPVLCLPGEHGQYSPGTSTECAPVRAERRAAPPPHPAASSRSAPAPPEPRAHSCTCETGSSRHHG